MDEPTYKVYDELAVEPEPIIAAESIHPAPAAAWAKGREFEVYKVPSRSMAGNRTVTYHKDKATIWCDCPARVPCAHIKSVLWKRATDAAFRLYADLTLPELEERHRDYIEIETGARLQARAWRAVVSALGDLIHARTMEGAA